jgi:hypothetical protein
VEQLGQNCFRSEERKPCLPKCVGTGPMPTIVSIKQCKQKTRISESDGAHVVFSAADE